MEPVIRCAQRELGWRTGLGDYYFENIKYCNKCHQPWSQILIDSDKGGAVVTLPLNNSTEALGSQNKLESNQYDHLSTIMNSHFDNDVYATTDLGTNDIDNHIDNVVFDDIHTKEQLYSIIEDFGYI